MSGIEAAVHSREAPRAAAAALEKARARHAAAQQSVTEARGHLEGLRASLADETERGDPDGTVPKLTARIREAETTVADAEAVETAAARAVDGAIRSQARAMLAGIKEVWAGRPVEKVAARVVSASSDLAAALSEYEALDSDRDLLRSWGVHLVSRALDGNGAVPALDLPDPLPRPKLAALRRAVDAARSDLPTPHTKDVQDE